MAQPPVRLILSGFTRIKAQPHSYNIPHLQTLHTIHPLTTKEPKTAPSPAKLEQTNPANPSAPTTYSKPKPSKIKPHRLPQRPSLPESTLSETFIHGSGPGGQKINKTASAVQLTHLPSGLVLKCQATRSRIQNRKIARQLLAEKLDVAERGDEARSMVKMRGEVRRKRSASKKRRRKYRALEGGREGDGDGVEEDVEDDEGDEEEMEGDEDEDGSDEASAEEAAGYRGQGEGESVTKMPSKAKDDVARLFEEARQRMGKTHKSNDAIK